MRCEDAWKCCLTNVQFRWSEEDMLPFWKLENELHITCGSSLNGLQKLGPFKFISIETSHWGLSPLAFLLWWPLWWPGLNSGWKNSGLVSLLTLILRASQAFLIIPYPESAWNRGKSSGFGVRDSGGKPKSTTDSVVKVFLSSLYTVYAWATGNFKKEIHFFQSCSQWDTWDPTELLQMEDSLYTLVLHCNFYQDFHLFLCLPGATKA